MSYLKVKDKKAAIESLQKMVDSYGAESSIGKKYAATIREIKQKAKETK